MGLGLVVLAFVFFLLALIPARKLWKAGIGLGTRVTYLATLILFSTIAFEARPLARFLLPVALLLYLLPFSGLPEWWARRSGRRPEAQASAPRTARSFRGSGGSRNGGATVIDGTAVHLDADAPATGETVGRP
jgi:hypothetical protein